MTHDDFPDADIESGDDLELASAYLDGACTAAEIARVEADPGLLDRMAALRAVRDLLAAPVSVTDDHREANLTAALAAFDAERGSTIGRPVDLAAERSRRRPWFGTRYAVGVAAAAAVIAAIGVTGSFDSAGDDGGGDLSAADEPTATALLESAVAADSLAAEADDGRLLTPADGADTTSTAVPAAGQDQSDGGELGPEFDAAGSGGLTPPDLGEFASLDELGAAARSLGDAADEAFAAPSVGAESLDQTLSTCGTDLAEPAVRVATATLAGQPVVLVTFEDDGVLRLLVLRASDCSRFATVPLDSGG